MSNNKETNPEVIEVEEVNTEENQPTKLIDRLGTKSKIAIGAIGAALTVGLVGWAFDRKIYGTVSDAMVDTLDSGYLRVELSNQDTDEDETEVEDEEETTEEE